MLGFAGEAITRRATEYHNTQNGANHAHSVWHDPQDGFAGDLLCRHHEGTHRGAHPSTSFG